MSENYVKWNTYSNSCYDYSDDCWYDLMLMADGESMWYRFSSREHILTAPLEKLGSMDEPNDMLLSHLKDAITERSATHVADSLVPPSMKGLRTWMRELVYPTMRQWLIAGVVGRALKVWQVPKLEDVFRAVYWGPENRKNFQVHMGVNESEFDGAHKAACVVADTLYEVFSSFVGNDTYENQLAWIKKWSRLS